MTPRVLFFSQPGCLSCELMKVFLEARGVAFEERDISADVEARRIMMEEYDSSETPTLVIWSGEVPEVVLGFEPARLDRLLDEVQSSDSVAGS
jgi:glutaredoxin